MNKIDVKGLKIGPATTPSDLAHDSTPVEDFASKASPKALEAISALTRALAAGGYCAVPARSQEAYALQVEGLDATLKLVTFDESHLKLARPIEEPVYYRVYRSEGGGDPPDVAAEPLLIVDSVYNYRVESRNSLGDVIEGGESLTEAVFRDAAKRLAAQVDEEIYSKLIVSPATMQDFSRIEATTYQVPVCSKCNRATPACTCYGIEELPRLQLNLSDLEETPTAGATRAAETDFEIVRTAEQLRKDGRAKLDTYGDGVVGGCYICAHPKRLAFPHKVTRIPFCADCCALVA